MLPAASRRLGLWMPIIRHEKRSCPYRPAAFLSAVSSLRASPASAAAVFFSTTDATYYDSQSGLHIPIHDETQIQVYWNAPLIRILPEQPHQHEQQHHQKIQVLLQTAIDRGMAGALIRNNDPDMLFQSLSSLLSPAERDFTVCVPSAPTTTTVSDMAVPNIHVNTMFEYGGDRDDDGNEEEDEATTNNAASLEESLSQHIISRMGTTGIHTNRTTTTSIGLFQKELYEKDPILVASNVASVLDAVGADGGGDLLWLLRPAPNNHENNGSMDDDDEDDDALVALCQELAYLDVTGPTMKSRLVVDASSPDQVEECLLMGINKFVLSSSSRSSSSSIQTDHHDDDMAAILMQAQLDWLQTVVQDQGKKLMISPS